MQKLIRCEECGEKVLKKSSRARYCSVKCGMRKYMRDYTNKRRRMLGIPVRDGSGYGCRVINVNGKTKIRARVIMEKHLGRKLKSVECVHHVDGNINHNNPSNLQIMSFSEHSKLHYAKNHHK